MVELHGNTKSGRPVILYHEDLGYLDTRKAYVVHIWGSGFDLYVDHSEYKPYALGASERRMEAAKMALSCAGIEVSSVRMIFDELKPSIVLWPIG